MKISVAALLALTLSAGALQAEPIRQGDLEIDGAWSRVSLGTMRPGVAYFTVRNLGNSPDRLVGLTSPVSPTPMLHETRVSEEGISRMTHMEDAGVPAEGELVLAPGGLHVMLMDLATPLEEGATFPLTLTFETAGEVTIEVPVLSIRATGPEG